MTRKIKYFVVEKDSEEAREKRTEFPSEELAEFYLNKKWKKDEWEETERHFITNGVHSEKDPTITTLSIFKKKEK